MMASGINDDSTDKVTKKNKIEKNPTKEKKMASEAYLPVMSEETNECKRSDAPEPIYYTKWEVQDVGRRDKFGIPITSRIVGNASSSVSCWKKNEEEKQYLECIRYILNNGEKRDDRTGVGTLATFGTTMRYSLKDGKLPLFTTKYTFWRGIAEELLWFVSGSTNAKELSAKGVRIWDGNSSREFLDKRGLTDYAEGDIGPGYGFQWRHFGAEYRGCDENYEGEGEDQLAECIRKIRNNPTDRRIVLSAWNPAALSKMALPPCMYFFQVYLFFLYSVFLVGGDDLLAR